ncbi:MAG TPA: DedA family protein [Rubrivivax sp.]|nr:DedA family protein [Rubrivivax sp.]
MSSSLGVSALVAQYGYWMVFFGALAEGESVLLAAGFAAHRGLLQLPQVIALAFAAGTLGDQLAFHLGRRHGPRLLARFPSLARQAQRLQPLLARHPHAAVLGVRFAYGLRTAGPIALGALGVPRWTFVWLNLLGAALWATGFSLLGWQFGNAMQWLLRDLHAVQDAIMVGLLAGGLVLGLLWWRRRRAS